MKFKSKPNPETAAYWRRHLKLAAQAASINAYCRDNGLSAGLLRYWRKRLDEEGEASAKASSTSSQGRLKRVGAAAFVRAVVADEPAGRKGSQPESMRLGGARIVTRAGDIVEFCSSTPPQWAASVIAAIGGRS